MADLKHFEGDAVSARKLNGVVDRLPHDSFGLQALVGALNGSNIRFHNDATAREPGQVVIVDSWDSVADPIEGRDNAVVLIKDPVWPGEWALVGIVVAATPADEYGVLTLNGLAVAEFSSLNPAASWAMIDPADTSKLKSATSGFARLLGQVDATHGLVQMGHVQPMWKYRALDVGDGTTDPTLADILELNGTVYSLATPVEFIGDIGAIDPGEIGAAFQTVNGFECLAGGGFNCIDLCDCELFF
jgi:hypothetical protein